MGPHHTWRFELPNCSFPPVKQSNTSWHPVFKFCPGFLLGGSVHGLRSQGNSPRTPCCQGQRWSFHSHSTKKLSATYPLTVYSDRDDPCIQLVSWKPWRSCSSISFPKDEQHLGGERLRLDQEMRVSGSEYSLHLNIPWPFAKPPIEN